eukprot:TRINITY_DN116253_c0_g1_i1.p1 TRINITY_DN116253_c0_g1~~TRINITY_DN116253_c0_g1_i1.p1  ORF type:complete len:190 (-),score=25.58 TRINITY_DN116253_c0_g1_i1:87-584(-)
MRRTCLCLAAHRRRPSRFTLAPPRDDVRHRGHVRVPGQLGQQPEDLEGVDDFAGEAALTDVGDVFKRAAPGIEGSDDYERRPVSDQDVTKGPGLYEECYGGMSRNKLQKVFWDAPATTGKFSRIASVPLSLEALVASGRPKEDIYRQVREAYGLADVEEEPAEAA